MDIVKQKEQSGEGSKSKLYLHYSATHNKPKEDTCFKQKASGTFKLVAEQ